MTFHLDTTAIEPDESTIEGRVQELENQAVQKAVP